MRSAMIRRIESDRSEENRREALRFCAALCVLIGVIVLGHNTIYGVDPELVGTVANTPALVIPIANLVIGLALVVGGVVMIRVQK